MVVLAFLSLAMANSASADKKTENDTAAVKEKAATVTNVDNEKLKELIDNNVLVVDIRREEEWRDTGIIKGSKTITFFNRNGSVNKDFLSKFTAVAKKDQPVVLICRTGVRTSHATKAIAQQLGYKNVINVTDGIMGWIGEKKPVTKY